ncbi:ADP-ribosylglycohydrolase [Macroventuria anomochaeta]|uniref:ADP-ribosylglycohydrolase n=1 Tax=Macroventuria anomochaeta TaxID=301207 RepID=A0ACB6RQ24_9PLEO|nr:ADP-ribosylglycohydrolase [Macroventuria anomochaeta]KAF2623228.1 ADP-ribosylglycohydrolase [Macroventuria anomochaeta]
MAHRNPEAATQQCRHPFVTATTVDKIYGCIIGSALGDTIGLYTEFMSKRGSEHAYSTRQFSLVEPATEPYPDAHRSQFEPSRLKIWVSRGLPALDRPVYDIGILVGSVVNNSRFLSSPLQCATDRWIKSSRHAAPNGSLMRTHPIGVIGVYAQEEETWQLSVDVGRTTHVDPRCVVACCISVGLVRGLLRGEIETEEDINAVIERAYAWVLKQPDLTNPGQPTGLAETEIRLHLERQEFKKHVYAETLDELQLDSQGEIGYVYKCLGSAVLLLRLAFRRITKSSLAVGIAGKAQLFEELMVALIMEGGDADTNGAAAGALLGAYVGYANLPSHWKLGIAHNEWLMAKTERLAVAVGVVRGTLHPEGDEAADGGRRPTRKG